jgi:hypothetical protein
VAYDHESVPENEKLILLLDYYVKQGMENQNVPIKMWNIYISISIGPTKHSRV